MDHQYGIINQGLRLLKQSHMEGIAKLQIEIQLIHMKRLLLNEVVALQIASGTCGENVFEEILLQIQRACGSDRGDNSIAELKDRLGLILSALAGLADGETVTAKS